MHLKLIALTTALAASLSLAAPVECTTSYFNSLAVVLCITYEDIHRFNPG
jgi:hypothetical protein